jgi:hypothetical protein
MPKRTDISSLPLIGAGPVAKCSGVSLPTDLSVSPRLRRNRSCRALQPPYRGAGLSRRSSHPRSRLADQTLSHAPTPAHNDAMPVHRNPAGDRHKVSLAPGNCFPVVFAAFRSATRQHPLAILPARPMTTINPQRGPAPMLSQRDRAQLWSARSTHSAQCPKELTSPPSSSSAPARSSSARRASSTIRARRRSRR